MTPMKLQIIFGVVMIVLAIGLIIEGWMNRKIP